MNYYTIRTHVSNSDLGSLRDRLLLRPKPANIQEIYNFGNLIDALITEPELVDAENMCVTIADGTFAHFTTSQFEKAQQMRRAADKSEMVQLLCKRMSFQLVILKEEFEIDCEFARFTLPVKIKTDGANVAMRTAADFKSTAATTQKQFIEVLSHFDYDRQAAWYMDIGGFDKFWFIGISKVADKRGNHSIFLHAVQRGDAMYLAGKAKYERLAYQYHYLIYGLNWHPDDNMYLPAATAKKEKEQGFFFI